MRAGILASAILQNRGRGGTNNSGSNLCWPKKRSGKEQLIKSTGNCLAKRVGEKGRLSLKGETACKRRVHICEDTREGFERKIMGKMTEGLGRIRQEKRKKTN